MFDEEGRFAPVFDQDDIETFDADTVILAIGQAIDLEALGATGPEISPRRTIAIDDETGDTRSATSGRAETPPRVHARSSTRSPTAQLAADIHRRSAESRRVPTRANGRAPTVPPARRHIRPLGSR